MPEAVNPQTGERLILRGGRWMPVPTTAARRSGETGIPGGGTLEAILQGATLGASDEIQAGMAAVPDWLGGKPYGEAFDERHGEIRGQYGPWSDENPGKAIGGTIAGSMLPTSKLVQAAEKVPGIGKAVSKIPGVVRYPAAGVGTGYAAGALSADPGQRQEGGLLGAALGLGTGVGGVLLSPIANALTSKPRKAARKVLDAFKRDETTPTRIARKVDQLGDDATISSAGGPNIRGLAQAAAQSPGLAARKSLDVANKVKSRQAGRVLAPMERALGRGMSARETFDTMAAARKVEAGPAYKKAYAVEIPTTDRLRELAERPSVKAAIERVRSLAAEEGAAIPNLDLRSNTLSTKGWDYIKRSLDDVISREHKEAITGRVFTEEGRAAIDTLKSLRTELDRLNPAYQAARDLYSGRTQSMQALKDGLQFIREPAEVTAKEIANMASGDRQFFMLGAARQLRERIEKKGDTHDVTRLFGNADMRRKLRAVFPDSKSYREFQRSVIQEARKFSAAAQTAPAAGSPTYRNQAFADETMGDSLLGIAADAVSGAPTQAVRSATAGVMRPKRGMAPEMSDELARILFEANPAQRTAILRALQNPAHGRAPSPAMLSVGGGAVGGLLSGP